VLVKTDRCSPPDRPPRSTTSPQHRDTNVSLTHHFIGLSSVGDIADERHPTPTTTATVELPTDALAAVDDRAADEHLTDPEDVREVALDYVDQVEVLTDDGEPVGEALARDPDDTE